LNLKNLREETMKKLFKFGASLIILLFTLVTGQDPKPGGVYRMVSAYDIPTLDPAQAGNFEDWWSSGLVLFQHLYQYDAEGTLFPEVAADFPTISEDGLTYTVPIRQGVMFSNGRELVAEDVAYTLERVLTPDTLSWGPNGLFVIEGAEAFYGGEAETISGINVIDDYTIEFTLNQPAYTFPDLMASSVYGIVPKQETIDAGADWGIDVLIGSGPFILTEFLPGEKVVYERNPHYYQEGLPYLDGVEIALNVPASVAALRVENGEADFAPADALPGAVLAQIQSDPAYAETGRKGVSGVITIITINPASTPFQDVRVRQAIALATDRETLSRRSGRGTLHDSLYPSPYPQFNPDFKTNYAYDLEAAKALMAEAGYGPDTPITGYSIFAGQGQELGEIIQADLKEIGIEAEVLTGNFSDFEEQFWDGEIFMTHFGAAGSFFDASEMIRGRYLCLTEAEKAAAKDPRANNTRWCDPTIDEMFNKAQTLRTDDPERTQLFRDIENKIINENVWIIVPYASQALALGRANIVGDDLHPLYTLPTLEDTWINE
jgi:ABC-type transport system substrate-binding protein